MRREPIYRWFVFPHSFSPQIIDEVVKEYKVPQGASLIDPFVGAGTTVLWAKQHGFSAMGTDLSPLSAFVTQAKIANYNLDEITDALPQILIATPAQTDIQQFPERIQKAFTPKELSQIERLRSNIQALPSHLIPFFALALLRVQQQISRAVPDGGWFRWIEKDDEGDCVVQKFLQQVDSQVADLTHQQEQSGTCSVHLLDARLINTLPDRFDALITSPPYPNRHDYSRVFHMELLALGASEKDVFHLRHASIRSHVEARNPDFLINDYLVPHKLSNLLGHLTEIADRRVVQMIKGYFEDMYICLRSAHDRLQLGAPCAYVIGNVRHSGIMIPVDEILIEIGEQVGFTFDCAWVARLRGNSAQQMATYGREPSRETIVIFRR
jgi:hypothetical protein